MLPWIIVCIMMLIWGNGAFKTWANSIFTWNYPVPELHNMINKVPPVAAKPTKEGAVFAFTYLSFTGTGMLIAAIISGLLMGLSPAKMIAEYGRTIKLCAISLITISAMLAIGTLTRLSGIDATLGLAFAATGVLYPFFGTLLGWLGVALTGSDTASNILFGNLQKITSEQLGLSPILMAAANSSGGVMGKMIDAQSIVVASTATNWYGHEGSILRLRVQAFDHAGMSCRPVRDAAGLCPSVHADGPEVRTIRTGKNPRGPTVRGDFLCRRPFVAGLPIWPTPDPCFRRARLWTGYPRGCMFSVTGFLRCAAAVLASASIVAVDVLDAIPARADDDGSRSDLR